MPIGITDDHEALRQSVRRFVDEQCPPSVTRAATLAPNEPGGSWDQIVELGWLGIAVSEANGGAGASCVELGVVIEELGRACAPGPFVGAAIAATLLDRCAPSAEQHAAVVAVLGGSPVSVVNADGIAIGSFDGTDLAVVADVDGWSLRAVEHRVSAGVDVVRPPTRAVTTDTPALVAGIERARGDAIVAVLLAAEAIGLSQWCVETASEYAKDRVQFGRPIGQFQGVKHRCADMLARTELARAAVWDALRVLDDPEADGADVAVAAAVGLAVDAAFETAKDCVQVLGGIGFTWEHDAHFYLRRSMAIRAFVGTGHLWRTRATVAALRGDRRKLALDLGPEAEALRTTTRSAIDAVRELGEPEQRAYLAAHGYITPGWPAPYGRDANALELLVIEEEFRAAKVARPSISIGAWALPNVIVYGTPEQQERWIMPTLNGEISWCQLFSEPGAGSDLAALSTKATRVDGGWLVNGQKVWTSMAKEADWGILLARTDPDVPKHDGISCFMLDMRSDGIDIRPLRELTGHAMFNEVFLNDVFVPDDCLIGAEHDGWRCARTTLANERVFMGGNSTIGGGVVGALKLLQSAGLDDDPYYLDLVGGLVVQAHALAVLGFRLTLSALGGADPSGSEAAVRKLLGVQHDQRTQEIGMELCGAQSVCSDGEAESWVNAFLFNRCLSIAGGTTEVQKNVIGERMLGLPRDTAS